MINVKIVIDFLCMMEKNICDVLGICVMLLFIMIDGIVYLDDD